jgi:thiamine-phosphate pyrophosphorylase
MSGIGGYYFITDHGLSVNGILDDVREAIAGGASVVQYRRKTGESRTLYEEALEVGRICREADVPFIVNDRMDIALTAGADGIHIGPKDVPLFALRDAYDGIIGISCSTLENAKRYAAEGADYLGVGPVYATTTKADAGEAVGPALIDDVRQAVDVPLIAIGGITLERVPEVMFAGADGICAISATSGEKMQEKVAAFVEMIGPRGTMS